MESPPQNPKFLNNPKKTFSIEGRMLWRVCAFVQAHFEPSLPHNAISLKSYVLACIVWPD